jgi:Xaa-Pro aminopeptidase
VVPERLEHRYRTQFVGDDVIGTDRHHPGRAVVEVLSETPVEGSVLATPTVPHDTALYVQEAGYDLESTDHVAVARRHNTDRERAQLTSAQEAAHAGLHRARDRLGGSDSDPAVSSDDLPTRQELRRAIDEAVVTAGAEPAAGTRICHSGSDGRTAGVRDEDEPLSVGEPIVVRCSPRTPGGYHGFLTRTIVVESDGGWERRAHVAITNARKAALALLAEGDGVTIGDLRREATAELRAYGFDHGGSSGDLHVDCHGLGLARFERPTVRRAEALSEGDVVGLELAVEAPDHGRIALADLVAVLDDGCRLLADPPTTLSP